MKLQLVRNQGDELRIGGLAFRIGHGIRGFALGVADGIAKESLQGVQISPIPGNLDGVADGPLHSGRRGAEVLGHLRVEHLGDGVACLTARWGATKACCVPFGFIAFFIVPYLTTLRV